ncbi:hybrid sensor histidine kinase/response regulator [Robbsia sp. Bb-Pol-6]|uniref:histidine kinase n=1 Tax=Robbsia betulipollinis TaxID=2981849 RepID=A0ABT3ZRN4_9BURK|nr:hybrid sensor histidine kinase/response regulator [Robbsia betulipollinis]MCY0389201.1 hybrid sensor histidine kinase/response regulator [Robbsia betulipollinis]
MSQTIKILLVDDVPQNIVALDALLSRPGVEALHAYSGAEALEQLLQNDIALALVDVQMPEMDGFELAELMRGSPRTRHVPIIFLTATDRDAMRTFRGYEAGAVDFLYKPFDPHILRSKVEVFVQLQSQKQQLAEQLEAVSQMVRTNEMFIAVLGHDLRNPLSSIMASAEVLRRVSDPQRVLASAERIRGSGMRMAKMIDQLLDVARMRSSQLVLTPTDVDLLPICEAIIGEFESPGQEKTVVLECMGDTVGCWDADRLAQVLSNLIGNALHHGDKSVPVTVRVDGTRRHELRITVTNAGEIPETARAHLFKPFRSGATAPQNAQGLGLGLFIAHELVALHLGRLEVRSDATNGTVFEIILPKRAGPAQIRAALSDRGMFGRGV